MHLLTYDRTAIVGSLSTSPLVGDRCDKLLSESGKGRTAPMRVVLPFWQNNGGAENRTRVQEPSPPESTCLDASLLPAFRGRVHRRRVSEASKTPAATSPVLSRPLSLSTKSRPAHLSDISLRAHEQLAARRSLTVVRLRGPILDYWQLCFPMLFNELRREARHASVRRT